MNCLMSSKRPFQLSKISLNCSVGRWTLSLADGVGEEAEESS